jgi:uncharacterized protein
MRRRLYILLSIMSVLLVYTIYKAEQIWPSHPDLAIIFSIFVFILMMSGTFLYRFNVGVYDKPWFRSMTWVGSLLMGVWAAFIIFSIPIDVIATLTGFFHPSSDAVAVMQVIAQATLLISLIFAAIGLIVVLRGARIRATQIPMENLDPDLRSLKIVQISDLHIGVTVRRSYVEQVVRTVNKVNPDVIFITGDLLDGKLESILEHMEPLRDLKAKHGIFYVTGNHEYYWGAIQDILQKLKTFGFQLLLNENRVVSIGGAKVLVAGVTDPQGPSFAADHKPDAEKAARSDQTTQLKILLAHRPDFYNEAEKLGFDLQLSGHTHAGQFFPFSMIVKMAHKYYRGLNRHGKLWVYVNPGTGYWGPANRFTVTPEISLITFA